MTYNPNECASERGRLESLITENAKLIKLNVDLSVIPTVNSEWQYKAYARLKASQERIKLLGLILKIISEFSAVSAFIATLASAFSS